MKTLVDAARDGADATKKITEVAGIPVIITPAGNARVINEALEYADARADKPRRRKGTATHQELASFIDHVNRFKDTNSAVFADTSDVTLTAVLDYHEAGTALAAQPRWGQHRSVYECPLSTQWQLWTAANGVKMKQDAFAQFIEDNMQDLTSPTGNGEDKDLPMPSEVLTMARNLVINSKGVFSRAINPTTGDSSLICKNESDPATSTRIPRAFLLGIPVFEAGRGYRVEARMRMDMSGGFPLFSFVLYQPDVIKRDAFAEVRQIVIEKTSLPLFAGSPE